LRATFPNPDGSLRQGQFVRARVIGAVRPNAILVPQKAVLQGAQGHFVIVVDKESKAQIRPVEVGSWNGSDWFINRGLAAGDIVVVDGLASLSPDTPVIVAQGVSNAGDASPATN
jgi:membrane fusion protein (multidrug efflux system)